MEPDDAKRESALSGSEAMTVYVDDMKAGRMSEEDDLGTLAAEEAADTEVKKYFRNVSRNDAEVITEILSTKAGRNWFYRKMISGNLMASPFAPGDPYETHVNLGRQDFAKEMQAEAMVAAPRLYLLAISEGKDEDKHVETLKTVKEPEEPTQPDLEPPEGFPGHVPPVKPQE
jgi:hypothetical protein